MEIGDLVRTAKGSSGLSVRRLSLAAEVAGSTITRIQSGSVEPSLLTLERILGAAGFDLRVEAVRRGTPPRPRLGELTDTWSRRNGRLRLDWTRWRALLDELALHPELTPEAIYMTPPPAGNRIVDALVAGVAEKLADDAGLPRPAWTSQVPALDEPYRPPVARTIGDREIPAQLEARGLMIDTGSLWRERTTVGV